MFLDWVRIEISDSIDTSRPVLQCPTSVVVYADAGETSARVTWDEPTASDNSGATVPVVKTGGPDIGTYQDANYYTVHYSATDETGNEANCQFSLLVRGELYIRHIPHP